MESKILSFLKKETKENTTPLFQKRSARIPVNKSKYADESELHIDTTSEYFEYSDYNTPIAVKTKGIEEQKN